MGLKEDLVVVIEEMKGDQFPAVRRLAARLEKGTEKFLDDLESGTYSDISTDELSYLAEYFASLIEHQAIREFYIRMLSEDDKDIRRRALEVLHPSVNQDKKVQEAFSYVISDQVIGKGALKALASIALEDENVKERVQKGFLRSSWVFGKEDEGMMDNLASMAKSDSEFRNKLIALLNDENLEVVLQSATVLALIAEKDQEVRQGLHPLMRHSWEPIRSQAIKGFAPLMGYDKAVRDEIFALCCMRGGNALVENVIGEAALKSSGVMREIMEACDNGPEPLKEFSIRVLCSIINDSEVEEFLYDRIPSDRSIRYALGFIRGSLSTKVREALGEYYTN